MTRKPAALILDFGGVLTTNLWDSIRACARREGLPENTLLDLLRDDPRIHPQFVQLERGQTSQAEFEVQLAAAAGISPDRLLQRMCAALRPDEAMLAAVATLRATGVRIGVLSKRKALEAGYAEIVTSDLPEWNQDPGCSTGSPTFETPQPKALCAVLESHNTPSAGPHQRRCA